MTAGCTISAEPAQAAGDATALDAFRAALGDRAVLTAAADLLHYETGARYDRGRALAVLRPDTTFGVSTAMAIAARYGLTLIPQSGNTGLVAGSTPDLSGRQVVLSLDRMVGVFDLDPQERVLPVSAGMRLSEVTRRLAAEGLFLPIDLGSDPAIGGMIATNTGGARYLRFGDMRRQVLGLTAVLGNETGQVVRLGGSLRKDNTRPDIKQLFIGTSGAFGIVTEAVLTVEPLPAQQAACLVLPVSRAAAIPLLAHLERRLGPLLSAFEGMSGNAVGAALSHVPRLRNPFAGGRVPDYSLLIEVSCPWPADGMQPSAEDLLQDALAGIMASDAGLIEDALFGPSEVSWSIRHALSDGVRSLGRLIAFDLGFRRGDAVEFIARMQQEMSDRYPGIMICDFGHIADGGVHFNLVVAPADPLLSDPQALTGLSDWVVDTAVNGYGASFSAEHAIGRKNQLWHDRYVPVAERELAEALIKALAPVQPGAARFGTDRIAPVP